MPILITAPIPVTAPTTRFFCSAFPTSNAIFHSDLARQCKGTNYCFSRGAYQSDGKVWWWLRSPGDESDDVTGVFFDGTVNYSGGGVNNVTGAVRPALWVNLEA